MGADNDDNQAFAKNRFQQNEYLTFPYSKDRCSFFTQPLCKILQPGHHRVYGVAGKSSGEIPIHQAVAYQMTDDQLDTVSPILLIGVGLAASAPLAGDINFAEEGALTATVTPVGQHMLRHLAGVQKDSLKCRIDSVASVRIARQGLAIQHKAFFGSRSGRHGSL